MQHDGNVGGIRDTVKQELALEFCRSQNKDICVLAETHDNQDHIYQIRNNWLGPIFFSPGDTFTKGILVLLHPGFDNVNDMTQIQKADLCFSRWLLLITGFSVSMLLRGMAIENNKGTLL